MAIITSWLLAACLLVALASAHWPQMAIWGNGNCKGAPNLVLPTFFAWPLGCRWSGPFFDWPLTLRKNGKVVLENPNVFGMSCLNANNQYYSSGSMCSTKFPTKKKKNFSEYCLTSNVGFFPGVSVRLVCGQPPQARCKPIYSTNRKTCNRKARQCLSSGYVLKWGSKGCRNNGITGDGGCQCKGYCGYGCKGPCNGDKECYWNATSGSCWHKPTPLFNAFEGKAVPECSKGGLLTYIDWSNLFTSEAKQLVSTVLSIGDAETTSE